MSKSGAKPTRKRGARPGVKHIRLSVIQDEEPELYAFLTQLPWGAGTTFVHNAVLAAMHAAQARPPAGALHVLQVPPAPVPPEPDLSEEDAELLRATLGQF